VLEQHPAVRQAMVDIREDVPGDKRLVAYLVSAGERPTVSALREHLGRQLPGYMIPAAYVFLEQFPLTTSGKVDRRALPAPEASRPELDESFAAPRTHTEETLAKIFAEVLGLKQVGIHDNFFELGGNSLQVTQLVSRVRATFRVELPLREMFQTPRVADLASAVEKATFSSVSADELAATLKELEDD
jgi:acyl carrier protein